MPKFILFEHRQRIRKEMFAVKVNSLVEWKVKEGGNVNSEVKGTVIVDSHINQ